jgi:hypothetical protein
MIKIEKVKQLNASKPMSLEDIESVYLSRVKTSKLSQGLGSINCGEEKKCAQHLLAYIDDILIGKPYVLNSHIQYIACNWSHIFMAKGEGSFHEKVVKAFDYRSFQKSEEKGKWFAKQLSIKSCPYCNAQFTMAATTEDGKTYSKFQFDHFYPKDKYPFLSVSMYNLIPVCAYCNNRKSEKEVDIDTHYHPYHNSIALLSKFKLGYSTEVALSGLDSLLDLDEGSLQIHFKPIFKDAKVEAFVKEHEKCYDINAVYANHTDFAKELLVKSKLYSGAGMNLLTELKGLFPDRDTALRYLLGYSMKEEEILQRPLTKMTQDIARDLGLID